MVAFWDELPPSHPVSSLILSLTPLLSFTSRAAERVRVFFLCIAKFLFLSDAKKHDDSGGGSVRQGSELELGCSRAFRSCWPCVLICQVFLVKASFVKLFQFNLAAVRGGVHLCVPSGSPSMALLGAFMCDTSALEALLL